MLEAGYSFLCHETTFCSFCLVSEMTFPYGLRYTRQGIKNYLRLANPYLVHYTLFTNCKNICQTENKFELTDNYHKRFQNDSKLLPNAKCAESAYYVSSFDMNALQKVKYDKMWPTTLKLFIVTNPSFYCNSLLFAIHYASEKNMTHNRDP